MARGGGRRGRPKGCARDEVFLTRETKKKKREERENELVDGVVHGEKSSSEAEGPPSLPPCSS